MHNVACITMAVLMVATKRIAEKLGELMKNGRKDAKTSYGIVCLLILIII